MATRLKLLSFGACCTINIVFQVDTCLVEQISRVLSQKNIFLVKNVENGVC